MAWTGPSTFQGRRKSRTVYVRNGKKEIMRRERGKKMSVNGKTAVITGANSGMGKASARMAGGERLSCTDAGANRERGKEALEELEKEFREDSI